MTKTPMLQARLEVETRDSVLVVRLDGGPLGLNVITWTGASQLTLP